MNKYIILMSLNFIIAIGCNKTINDIQVKKNNNHINIKLTHYYNNKYSVIFSNDINIINRRKSEEYLMDLNINYNDTVIYMNNIYSENGHLFRFGEYPIPSKKNLELKIILAIPLDFHQAKKIADYYKIGELPKRKDTITLTNYQNFSSDLKTLKTDSGKSLYDEVFHKIEFNLLFQDKLEDKQAELIIYDWLNDTTYKPE